LKPYRIFAAIPGEMASNTAHLMGTLFPSPSLFCTHHTPMLEDMLGEIVAKATIIPADARLRLAPMTH
jgi:hypothetical protein